MRALGWVLASGWLLVASAAGAEPPNHQAEQADGSQDQDTIEVADPLESPELRALRAAEREMFGAGSPGHGRAGESGQAALGEPPAALTSDAPGQAPSPEPGPGKPDRPWLRDLELPDIPVRWDERVLKFLEFFRQDPRGQNVMRAWLARAERYGPMIRRVLREHGLPEDLLYVAMIESGFEPRARSHAQAVGLWQFVLRTGGEYGLQRTHWVDERMDPKKATQAAARFLADLKQRFGGWELALAAYNMGYGALLRAIRKYNTNDYWVLSRIEAGLPFETSIYVAKVMATAVVGRNPERFGFGDLKPAEAPETETVRVPGGVSLRLVARAANMDADRLARLNPELRRERVPPDRQPYALELPSGKVETFHERWQRFRPGKPAHRSYVMRFGETLRDVAKRFRTSRARLRRINELDRDAEVGVGTTLLVPAVEPRTTGQDDAETEKVAVAVPEVDVSYENRKRVFYRVDSGDTLQRIARFFSVPLEELTRWNHVDAAATLQPGMVLQLYVPQEVDLSRAQVLRPEQVRVLEVGSQEFFKHHESGKDRVRFHYTVQQGDSLSSVAERFGVSVGDLARINRFARDTTLRVGQRITVYAKRDQVPAQLLAQAEDEDGEG
jgi:membrane-bound lytic murein transglycosylase D